MPKSSAAAKAALKKFDESWAKSYGDETIVNTTKVTPYEVISTGSLSLDDATEVGGLVEGRIVESWGPEDTGKSTLAIIAAAQAQKKHPDKLVAYIDMERKHDLKWMQTNGLNITRGALRILKPKSAEEVADMVKDLVRSGLFSMVIVDSVAAMIPKVEIDKMAEEAVVAAQAKIVTRMVGIAASFCDETGTVLYLINQVRANISSYGADTKTSGGFALRHGTTMKFKLSRTGTPPFTAKIGGDDVPVGHEAAVLVERNKVGQKGRRGRFVLFTSDTEKYGPAGIDVVDDIVTIGLKRGVILQAGGHYTVPTGEKVHGRDKLVDLVRSDPDTAEAIREAVLTQDIERVEVTEDMPDTVEEVKATGKSVFAGDA
jgi:recombination protein RecA